MVKMKFEGRGERAPKMPGDKARWLCKHLSERCSWAASGVTELVAVRNAIVHSGGRWDAQSIATLKLAGVTDVPAEGAPVLPGIDDILRYKRAVRTAVFEIAKVPPAPH